MITRRDILTSAAAMPVAATIPSLSFGQMMPPLPNPIDQVADVVIAVDQWNGVPLGEVVRVPARQLFTAWYNGLRDSISGFASNAMAQLGSGVATSNERLRALIFRGWSDPGLPEHPVVLGEFYSQEFLRAATAQTVGQFVIAVNRIANNAREDNMSPAETAGYCLSEGVFLAGMGYFSAYMQQLLTMHLYHKQNWNEQPARWVGWGLATAMNSVLALYIAPAIHNGFLLAMRQNSTSTNGRRLLGEMALMQANDMPKLGTDCASRLWPIEYFTGTTTGPGAYPYRSAKQVISLRLSWQGQPYTMTAHTNVGTVYPPPNNGVVRPPYTWVQFGRRLRQGSNPATDLTLAPRLNRRLDCFSNNTGPFRVVGATPLSAVGATTMSWEAAPQSGLIDGLPIGTLPQPSQLVTPEPVIL